MGIDRRDGAVPTASTNRDTENRVPFAGSFIDRVTTILSSQGVAEYCA